MSIILDDLVDDIINYESFLGHGSFGFVLKAECIFKTYSCIKFIYPMDDDQQKVQNEREASLFRRIPKHRNIITVKDSVRNKYLKPAQLKKIFNKCPNIIEAGWKDRPQKIKELGWTCIKMELCGENLASWLRHPENTMDSLIDQLKQVQIIEDLVSGLSFLHKNQIIHRDLKPANVMFTKEYRLPIKIGDFGQCRTLWSTDNSTLTRSNIGTPTYSAPEVLSGKYSYQSDIFSLGLIIWEVIALIKLDERRGLFSRLVYDGETDLVAENHPLVGKLVRQLVINSTRKKVEERFQTMDAIIEIIKHWPPLIPNLQIPNKILTCRNGEELELYLSIVPPDYTIVLEEGIYQGRFEIGKSNLTIVGRGVEKTLTSTLHIYGNNCSVSNLSIFTSSSFKVDLTFLDFTLKENEADSWASPASIFIYGNGSTLSNINIMKGSRGIKIWGSDVKIYRVKFTHIEGWCITLDNNSSNCTIMDVSWEIVMTEF
ncbi:putative serine/threonine-protein kinase zyg-1 [Folsomia candida]|uniref:Putative serine/threonine-protein kinase zyg-1 n=1 Tax=Folsomia candida TaxID=158441 RepID=A0A226DWQ3_FOLCA|nr:putative serine/threonine-protein kinase zyg-1 [Folsomia candida]